MNFIQSIRAEQFEHVDFSFFASDSRSTRNNWKAAHDLGDSIIDLSYALEDEVGASIRSPWIERQTGQSITPELQPGPAVVAHGGYGSGDAGAAQSEGGKDSAGCRNRAGTGVGKRAEGEDQLHEQTVNLLSFQELPKNVYDVQVAFNIVARYGPHSKASLEKVAERIRKHYRRIAAGAPEFALQVLQTFPRNRPD